MESLYRGKRVDNGEWIEGGIETCKCRTFIIFQLWGFTTHHDDRYLWRSVEVDTETVAQYIGLKDKDEKKIFGDDIVETTDGERYFIKYNEHSAMWELVKKVICEGRSMLYTSDFECIANNELKIIGNIHDNPELLESKGVRL